MYNSQNCDVPGGPAAAAWAGVAVAAAAGGGAGWDSAVDGRGAAAGSAVIVVSDAATAGVAAGFGSAATGAAADAVASTGAAFGIFGYFRQGDKYVHAIMPFYLPHLGYHQYQKVLFAHTTRCNGVCICQDFACIDDLLRCSLMTMRRLDLALNVCNLQGQLESVLLRQSQCRLQLTESDGSASTLKVEP